MKNRTIVILNVLLLSAPAYAKTNCYNYKKISLKKIVVPVTELVAGISTLTISTTLTWAYFSDKIRIKPTNDEKKLLKILPPAILALTAAGISATKNGIKGLKETCNK